MVGKAEDSLERKTTSMARAGSLAAPVVMGLPVNEPITELPLRDKRAELVLKVEELRGVLRYVGERHPKRVQMVRDLKRMEGMLVEINKVIAT